MHKLLEAKNYVNSETGFRYHYVRSDTEKFTPHYHNYYEFFMVKKGVAHHTVNNTEQFLPEGSLLFIRDFDCHEYKRAEGKNFEFFNLAVSKEIIEELFDYLGEDFPKKDFLTSSLPPIATLTGSEQEKLFYRLTELGQDNDISKTRLKLKKLLVDIFTGFFTENIEKQTNIPLWLEITCEKMKKPDNFIAGLNRMYEISGKSREHLSRSFKNYYNTTPTDFITGLRLQYCTNLLLNSNLSVTDICYRCGFDNISWFYKIFYKSFGTTPLQYRKKTHLI